MPVCARAQGCCVWRHLRRNHLPAEQGHLLPGTNRVRGGLWPCVRAEHLHRALWSVLFLNDHFLWRGQSAHLQPRCVPESHHWMPCTQTIAVVSKLQTKLNAVDRASGLRRVSQSPAWCWRGLDMSCDPWRSSPTHCRLLVLSWEWR